MPVTDSSMSVAPRASGLSTGKFAGAGSNCPSAAAGQEIAITWLNTLALALAKSEPSTLRNLFRADGYWRDHLALTWDLRTFAGPALAADGLKEVSQRRRVSSFQVQDAGSKVFEHKTRGKTIETFFTFETDIAWCRGHLRLILAADGSGEWRAWTFFTSMEELKGFEEQAGTRRPGKLHRTSAQSSTDLDDRKQTTEPDPQVLVVGAGHAGLAIAARLAALDVDTLVIDREEHIGDNWRNRYQSLLLHNQIAANHLPYLPFPSTWPSYLSKEHMAEWLVAYAAILGLKVWTSTTILHADYDQDARRWTVQLSQPDGTVKTLHPRHLVQATGIFGSQNRPIIAGAEQFDGRLTYASDYKGGDDAEGRRVLVVGTGSSGHDVAQDLCNAGAEVTMLQRSSTCVVSVDPGAARAYSIYSDDGLPIADADFVTNSFPFPLVAELHKDMTRRIAEMDRDLLQGLRAAGFALDFGEDESGFLMKYHRYGGGYYINVGCSELIIAGKIKIKHGAEIERLKGKTVVFTDGTSLDVDMVVIAAGYANMSASIGTLLGDEVAERVGPVWGLDPEGEVRAMWRRTGQPGFWLMGGSLQQCRPYSKYLALQIKAAEVGLI